MILQMTSLYFDGRCHVCYFKITITRKFLCIVTLRLTPVEEVQDHGSSWVFGGCGGGDGALTILFYFASFISVYYNLCHIR
jgi:hypothetical protein